MTRNGKRAPAALLWFREDLRLADNPALDAALRSGAAVTALYVLDDETEGQRALGGASRWWLARSLRSLAKDCAAIGLPFAIRRGKAGIAVPHAARETGVGAVFWNRRYGAAEARADVAIRAELEGEGIAVEDFNGRLLHEPWDVKSRAGEPLRVFSPFWRAAMTRGEPRAPLPRPTSSRVSAGPALDGVDVESLALDPTKPDWAGGLRNAWEPGEAGARKALGAFLDSGLKGYAETRDRPDMSATSRMSPYLRFGEVSPHQLWHAVEAAAADGSARAGDVEKFRAELGWREFSYHLLQNFPDLASRNVQQRFDDFPWSAPTQGDVRAWRKGLTGYPIVDAGMRQLWTTGWLHNRVRMIVASFLIKDLLIDWREGEAWFWDTLVDADPANNAASWQWVAGTGADAAPYFRVFNPSLQGARHDPDGAYVRAFVPELTRVPAKWIHAPWAAPPGVLEAAGVSLGRDYPKRIVDHDAARSRALAAFGSLKTRTA
ncbi:cryptochrome/photolyase family protein [Hansschlegelia plantiphila]|uniref:Deoxyribodipyrimidine photo-lyase n=1 Tax=Hansschlegelia plantiphila TaxID=374655 RepID=A0A9W6J5H1_9HYPH|nr:deoxyribodipyrimidine photo-lyase [Hansschlegelia plantiphila]GLK69590.1 deoxyribodipyrimidine photo-lyase [Hansschlegelia plantiphila]